MLHSKRVEKTSMLHSKRVEKTSIPHSKRVENFSAGRAASRPSPNPYNPKVYPYSFHHYKKYTFYRTDPKYTRLDSRFSCNQWYDLVFKQNLHSLRVQFPHLLHSFRVYLQVFLSRFECILKSSPLVSSVFLSLLHSFRVQFSVFLSRFECIFKSSPLVSSVVFTKTISAGMTKRPNTLRCRT